MNLKPNGHLLPMTVLLLCLTLAKAQHHPNSAESTCSTFCTCQHAPLKDLSISRWISVDDIYDDVQKSPANLNEVAYANDANDDSGNPMLKLAMCILPDKRIDVRDVLVSLPPDVQALVLLYNNGADKNITLYASDLVEFGALCALELRATVARSVQFVLDDALPALLYASFERVELIGTRPQPNVQHPSEQYDYVPESERIVYNSNLSLAVDDEPLIVSYEEYQQEQRMAKMATFGDWKALRVLRVHECALEELHWQMFYGLDELQHLSLERNGIASVPPFALFGAQHLRSLSLAHNAIADLNYRALANLLHLERLDLSDNQLAELAERSFPPFPKLRRLDVRDNPIARVMPMTFAVMNGTQHMTFGSQSQALVLRANEAFSSLASLRTLSVDNATGSMLSLGVFRGLRQLRSLRLHGIVPRIEYDAFAELVTVQELVLSRLQLELISMDTFFGTRDLEIVDLSENRLQTLPYGLFDGQSKIKEVYLQDNRLTALPGDLFRRPLALRLLRLTGNPWQCSCPSMGRWRQQITNAERAGRVNQRCVQDLSMAGGRRVRCNDNTNQFEYRYNARLTPRCASGPTGRTDVAGRCVYYTLRKTLQCVDADRAATKRHALDAQEHLRQQLVLKKRRMNAARENQLRYQLRRRPAVPNAAKNADISNDL